MGKQTNDYGYTYLPVGNKSLVNCKVHEFSSLLPLVVLTSEDEDRVEQLYNFLREKGAIIHKLII